MKTEINKPNGFQSLFGIRAKLILGFGAITAIFLITIAMTLSVVDSTKKYANKVIGTDLPSYNYLLDLSGSIYLTESNIKSSILTDSGKYKTAYQNAWDNIFYIIETLNGLSINWSKEHVMLWKHIKEQLNDLKLAQDKIINASDKKAALLILTDQVEPIVTELSNNLNSISAKGGVQLNQGLIDQQNESLHQGTTAIIDNLTKLQMLEYIISIVGMLSAILIATITAKGILRYINIFRRHSSQVASGDLTEHIQIETNDELGQLGHDLNKMTSNLSIFTKEIIQACHVMVSTLEEVRHSVDSQSVGASEQASSINQITASITEIEKSSAQTMDKARLLGEVAERTREKGQMGVEAVEQSILGMKLVREKVQLIAQTILDLSRQSQQVGEITAVVNNLAQQSKMLALNASIEAAKAGEAGKGFAVVAVEVKNLAEQSEQSTAQVQKILEDIRHATEKAVMVTEEGAKGVDHGTGLVEQTGDIVRSLNDIIHEATLASQQIEAAVRQEGAGIEQITAGMNEINQVTATFVEGSKQTTEAMSNLAVLTKTLKSQVDIYKV